MPDYSACANTDCIKRHNCCRYLMKTSKEERQSFALIGGDGSNCDIHWPTDRGAPFELMEPEVSDAARTADRAMFASA